MRSNHWPEYVCEAAALGTFMISAGGFGILLFDHFSDARCIFRCAFGELRQDSARKSP